VLRSVLEDLIKETPDDLLQKELWCSATGAAEYWSMQQVKLARRLFDTHNVA